MIKLKKTIHPSGYEFEKDDNFAMQLQASQILSDVTNKIEFIYNSPAIDKLRDIAEGN